MKYPIMAIAIISVLVWSINYFSANKNYNLTPQTVFEYDYQGRQLILRNINLYPSVPLARAFQNKAVIVVHKYIGNLLNLLDPNYYFFGSHPRKSQRVKTTLGFRYCHSSLSFGFSLN